MLTTIKKWIADYIRANIGSWIKDFLEEIIARIDKHEAELQKVNVKLDNDYTVLSELAGEDYPDKAKQQREEAKVAAPVESEDKSAPGFYRSLDEIIEDSYDSQGLV